MRVVDLDRDMSDVIPTGMSRDSEFLFDRMTEATLEAAMLGPNPRVLDVASGVGQDTISMALRGARAIGAEPSRRMIGMSRMLAEEKSKSQQTDVAMPGSELMRNGISSRLEAVMSSELVLFEST